MGALAEFLRAVVSGLFAQSGLPWFAAALVLSLAVLGVRMFLERRRLSYEEVYNSKIGFHRPFDQRGTDDYKAILRNFNNVSVVVIRVWNSGRARIAEDDYLRPLEFVASDRYIVDFRVSEVVPPHLVTEPGIESAWRVGPSEDLLDQAGPGSMTRTQLRQELPTSLYSEAEGGPGRNDRRNRRKLVIPPLPLARDHSFKVVICLREDRDLDEDQSTEKDYEFRGRLQRPGLVIPRGELGARRRSWVRRGAVIVAVASLILLVGTFLRPPPPAYCADGDLTIVGSSAFEPTTEFAAGRYGAECSRARIRVVTTSSLDGVRELRDATSPTLAFSDGTATGSDGFDAEPIAVLTYSVIVNETTGVTNLTRDQLRAVYSGRVVNWSQVGGRDLPVRIVGRNADSGSRQTFEKYVLGGGEGSVTSNACLTPDRGFPATVTRCERQSTQQLTRTVSDVDGAIGYADSAGIASYPRAKPISIDGIQPTPSFLDKGYDFWTIEYVYRKPGVGLLGDSVVAYIRGDVVARRMSEQGYVPCITTEGDLQALCRPGRR